MMRKIIFILFIVAMLMPTIPAMAVSPAGERYINQIVGGGNSSLRRASQSIYHNGHRERIVLDVLAEKLLQTYSDTSHIGVDALAWACKALGQSGDIRYRNVLQAVNKKAKHSKVRKYAKQSLNQMPAGKAKKPYKKGSVNLKAMKKKLAKGQSPVPASKKPKGKKKSGKKKYSLSAIKKGMSLQEVNALVGEPTSTTGHITGKSFNPFYYGSDHARLIHLYQGRGRIHFSQSSRYSRRVWRVMEVEIDPGEPGYP
jgi:hypothetical protein